MAQILPRLSLPILSEGNVRGRINLTLLKGFLALRSKASGHVLAFLFDSLFLCQWVLARIEDLFILTLIDALRNIMIISENFTDLDVLHITASVNETIVKELFVNKAIINATLLLPDIGSTTFFAQVIITKVLISQAKPRHHELLRVARPPALIL